MKAFNILVFLLAFSLSTKAQDIYEVFFTVGTTQHRAALYMDWTNGSGLMRVRYYSNGVTQMIEQTMAVEKTNSGIRIAGYNPVYAGTTRRHPSYIADNFYIFRDENGRVSIINVDDRNVTANCTIRSVSSYYTKQEFLKTFNWRL